jgi:hypothetical protein
MDHYSILEAGPTNGSELKITRVRQNERPISAALAEAEEMRHPAEEHRPRLEEYPDEAEEGRSLADMARADLDATLQLLADRAQYITGASGAAIALRRGEQHEMLCRASAGSSAPELGAVLSMEHGLSGECVRTRLPLRCDHAASDARVNRAVCLELGIASVLMMPIVSEETVLGVFELFSGKPRAFGERDLSTLRRLGQMVEMAVKQANAAQRMPAILAAVRETSFTTDSETGRSEKDADGKFPGGGDVEPTEGPRSQAEETARPLLWSAASRAKAVAPPEFPQRSALSGLRSLHKCAACGFPVSQGRALCVDCEEKKWRGHKLADPASAPEAQRSGMPADRPAAPLVATFVADAIPLAAHANEIAVAAESIEQPSPSASVNIDRTEVPGADGQTAAPFANDAPLFLSATVPSQSWLRRNKILLLTLLLAAIMVAALKFLH